MRRDTLLCAAVVTAVWGCGDDVPLGTIDDVVRPAGVTELSLTATSFAMPDGWEAREWYVAVHDDGRMLAGGPGGLYLLGEAVEALDAGPVRGIIADNELGFIVATVDGLRIYDGTIYESALDELLEVQGIVRRGAEIWLTADGMLHVLDDGALTSYPELLDVAALRTHDAACLVVVEDGAGGTTILRDAGAILEAQAIGDEIESLALASAGPQDRLFALAGGALVERVLVEGGVAWRRVALSSDPADAGAEGVSQMAADPVGGALWITAGDSLRRIDGGGVVSTVEWAVSGESRIAATADGAVWMAEGGSLLRLGPDAPPPSYEQHVVPFYEENCAKCHEPGGEAATVTRFGTYDEFAARIDDIIEQVESGTMPSGDYELVGASDLPRQWREGGMRP